MPDGAVIIDLSLMRGVHVNPGASLADAEGGALIGDLDRESQLFGLATPGGLVATTGLAGLALGGGYGYLARRFGLTCDNLRSAEMVTADGAIVIASAEENPDLFWAIRGGGGNFGVVTRLELELHPFGPTVVSGDVYYGLRDAPAALRAWRDLLLGAPDDLYLFADLSLADKDTPVPDEHHGKSVLALNWTWVGDETRQGERVAEPLHRVARPLAQYVNELDYVQIQSGPDGLHASIRRVYWKSSFMNELPDSSIETFISATDEVNRNGRKSGAELISMGGAISRVDADATAYRHRDALVDFLAAVGWEDPAEDDDHLSASRQIWETVAGPAAHSVYVNNLGDEGQDRVMEAYGEATYRRLAEAKRRFDPDNVFRHTANIVPANS
jgi:FAD/FMN-containing dehydrogenase